MCEDAAHSGIRERRTLMQKKTMGAFISALRRAKGMTQRELGEQLFVSDKTVSRWERDECTPDLSLIPLIADLFGVTADELLRGERKSADASKGTPVTEQETAREAQKSDRRFRALLDRRYTHYRNLSVISLGISLLGVIVAAVINLGFLRAQIGFWVATALMLCAAVCQLCFLGSARICYGVEDEDEPPSHREAMDAHNRMCLLTAKNVLWGTLLLFAFCLPLATLVSDAHWGLTFDSWLLHGLAYTVVALIALHCLWELVIRKRLTDRGTLSLSDRAKEGYRLERRLLGRTLGLLLSVGAVVLIAATVIQGIDVTRFSYFFALDTKEDFIAFAESDTPVDAVTDYKWLLGLAVVEQSVAVHPSVDVVEGKPLDDNDEYLRTDFYGRDGEVLFRYVDRRDISRIQLSDTEDGFPVKAYTGDQIRAGYVRRDNLATAFAVAYVVFGAVTVAVYVKRLRALRRKYR